MVQAKRMSLAEGFHWAYGLVFFIQLILEESEAIVDSWRIECAFLRQEKQRALPREPDPKSEPWNKKLASAQAAGTVLRREQDWVLMTLDGIGKRIPPTICSDGVGWEIRAKMSLQSAFTDAIASASWLPTERGYSALHFPERCRARAKILSERLDAIEEFRAVISALPPVATDVQSSDVSEISASIPSTLHFASEFQPAGWFPKGMADRLRQAARKDRKTKRVATRMIDGVKCYSVADARRWWSSDVPKYA